jgi:hypothetical protein
MEITSTRVAPEGQMIAVEFLGEGGEIISVIMNNVENNIVAENAVLHARALLAQVSAFGGETDEAINSYDALRNGNLDDGEHHALANLGEIDSGHATETN